MKKIIPFLLAATLVACGKSEPTATSNSSAPIETVESLAANPERADSTFKGHTGDATTATPTRARRLRSG